MPNQYCKSCGSATSFVSASPKFCSGCGEPFAGSVSPNVTLAKSKKSNVTQPILFIREQDNEESEVLPEIEKLEYSVKGRSSYQGEKLRDIVGGEPSDTGRIGSINRKAKRPKIDPRAFMADAKSQGKENPIEIGE